MTLTAFDGTWLERFHRGDRASMESCYREHFATVERAIGSLLTGADRETVIHELFSRLISNADLRRSFQGGSLGAWLARVARNQAIDFHRRQGREVGADDAPADGTSAPSWETSADARLLVDRFKQTQLPAGWLKTCSRFAFWSSCRSAKPHDGSGCGERRWPTASCASGACSASSFSKRKRHERTDHEHAALRLTPGAPPDHQTVFRRTRLAARRIRDAGTHGRLRHVPRVLRTTPAPRPAGIPPPCLPRRGSPVPSGSKRAHGPGG